MDDPSILNHQQFPLTIRLMGALERADRICSDEFIALAMDEELQKRDASVMRPATDSQRELLVSHSKPKF